ncbi:MAG: MATE family efflux transporter [Fusobacteriaceae bacterium]|jgi:putative MATE family efflux protein|nr:MATE family efflux transporter [Fusobacteriaceae bacterium]
MIKVFRKFIPYFSVQKMIPKNERIGTIPRTKDAYMRSIKMSWPCVVESVLVSLVGAVDTMMVGGLGANSIAAVGLTNQPKFLLLAIIISLNVGVTAVVARRKGEGNIVEANKFLRQSIMISFVLSSIISILGFIFAADILKLAGAEDIVIGDSVAYYQILMASIFFTGISLTINAAQRGVGNTKVSMRTNVAANVVNLIGNYFLINGIWIFPRLEVRGAAIATAIGSFVACILSILSLFYRTEFLDLKLKYSWKPNFKGLKQFFAISASAGIEQVFIRVGFFSYAIIIAKLGTLAFAVHQICMHVANFSFCFGEGIGIGSSALLGQSLGAKRPDKAVIYGNIGQRMAFIASTALFVLFIVFRRYIVMAFNTEEHIVASGSIIIVIMAFTTHMQTSQAVYLGCLRGAGDTKFVAIISLISIGFMRPVLALVLCFGLKFGLTGAWYALFADQLMRFVLSKKRFDGNKWAKIDL